MSFIFTFYDNFKKRSTTFKWATLVQFAENLIPNVCILMAFFPIRLNIIIIEWSLGNDVFLSSSIISIELCKFELILKNYTQIRSIIHSVSFMSAMSSW